MWWLRRRGERGAVAVITAIFVSTVVLAVGLITIDTGRVYVERRQLQNGADAAALAVAQSCAKGSCDSSLAGQYADGNANDGSEGVIEVCGTFPGLPGCTAPGSNALTRCDPPSADSGLADADYAQVRTRTAGATGSVVKSLFDGPDKTVEACARAAAGGVRTATGIAWTASLCVWNDATHDGTVFPAEVQLGLKGKTCTNSTNGWSDAPGSFGWLDDPTSTCQSVVNIDDTYATSTGNDFPQPCRDVFKPAVQDGTTVFMPIFDGVDGTGTNAVFHFIGWAAFHMTGYDLNGGKYPSNFTCTTVRRPCIGGYFTQALITTATAIGGQSYGAIGVGLSG